jgi:CRP-like cAMP-binding protein
MSSDRLPPEVLEKIPIFDGFSERELAQLAEIGQVETFAPGDTIVHQGHTCQNLWIVLEGQCEVVRQADPASGTGELVLATLGPFEIFGEMSFFRAAPHSAGVRAVTPIRLLKIARADYHKLIEHGAAAAYKLAYNTVESLAERLRRMDDWVARLVSENHSHGQSKEWSRFREKLFQNWNL